MINRLKLNNNSFIHKRIRHNVKILEEVTNSTCVSIDNYFSGFLLFVTNDKKCDFIITINDEFYILAMQENYSDNINYILQQNTKLIDSIFEDFEWLLLDYN